MKHYLYALALGLLLSGCVERSTPTSPVLEQRVFNALGGLRVGEALTLRGASTSEIALGGHLSAGEYVLVPFHASQSGAALLDVSFAATGLAPAGAAASGSGGVAEAGVLFRHGSDMHEELHAWMQDQARALLASPGPRDDSRVSPALNDLRGSNAFVGQLVQLNANASGDMCTTFSLRTGRVEAITEHAIVVADVNNPTGGFTRADYQQFGEDFDRLAHPTVTRYFASPTDIDGNARVIIFFTRAVNELTLPGSEGFVGGFFWARDLFTRAQCAASNEGEIFFMLAPDPNRQASGVAHTRDQVLRSSLGTIAHEYQHLVNAGRRIHTHAAGLEETWLDEGLSHVAEELLFYTATGIAPGSNVESTSLGSGVIDALNRYMVANLSRYGVYLQNARRESPIRPDVNLQARGAAWSFLRYVADHSPRSDEDLFRALADTRRTGFDNLAAVLSDPPLDWLRRWGVSVYTDDLVQGGDPLLQQPSWNFRQLLPQLFSGRFPLQVESLTDDRRLDLTIRGGSSGYVRARAAPATVARVQTSSGGAAPPAELHVTVVRIQ